MRISRLLALLAVASILAALAWRRVAACHATDQDLVRRCIQDIAAGAREGDPGEVLRHVSRSYRDEDGTGFEELRAMVMGELLRRGPISVVLTPVLVELHGDRATARFQALLAEGADPSRGRWLPRDARGWDFRVELVRDDAGWRVASHRREPWHGP